MTQKPPLAMPDASTSHPYDRDAVALLGLPIDRTTLAGAADVTARAARTGQGLWLSTVNLNWVTMALADDDFRQSILASDFVTCDGGPLVRLAGIMGAPLPERVAGSDLYLMLRDRNEAPIRTFFLGGRDDSARRAAAVHAGCEQGLVSVGHLNPGFGSVEELSRDEVIDAVNAAAPELLIVAFGAKKGQEFIARNRHRLTVGVITHWGAVVDFAAGAIDRAPKAVQKTGLEWAWRIGQDPSLWRRYAQDGAVVPSLLSKANAARRAFAAADAAAQEAPRTGSDGPGHLFLNGRFRGEEACARLGRALLRAEEADRELIIETAPSAALGPRALALLLIAQGRFAQAGHSLELTAKSAPLRTLCHLNRLPLSSGHHVGDAVSDQVPTSRASA